MKKIILTTMPPGSRMKVQLNVGKVSLRGVIGKQVKLLHGRAAVKTEHPPDHATGQLGRLDGC